MTGQATVAVLTFRRPDDLAVILPELVKQAVEQVPPARVLVVDNDPAGSAGEFVGHYADVGYVHEPEPGIAAARNRALAEADARGVLIFVDDDELPQPGWLSALLRTHAETAAAAVVGPVVSTFDGEPDPWIRAGRFFDRRRLVTGTPVDVAATNNLLLDLAQIGPLGIEFDDRYGLTGGSDTLFTRTLAVRGASMVWCDEALVADRVPVHRVTRRWVLQRALRMGNSGSRVALEMADRSRAALIGAGAIRLFGGLGRAGLGLLLANQSHQARGLRTGARGLGMVTGACGFHYAEYRRKSNR